MMCKSLTITGITLKIGVAQGQGGEVVFYKNGSYVKAVSSALETFQVVSTDNISLEARSTIDNYEFNKFCEPIHCTTTNPITRTVGNNNLQYIAYFKNVAPTYYRECQNNICKEVPGTGTNTCEVPGASCGTINKHKICSNNICTEVDGTGTDECLNIGAECKQGGTHRACVNNKCVEVDGSGSDECATINSDCTPSTTDNSWLLYVVAIIVIVIIIVALYAYKK